MSQPVPLVCSIDLSALKIEQLLLLEREMKIELEKRGHFVINDNYENNEKKKKNNDIRKISSGYYVNKWDAWRRANENRSLNWNWTKKKKGWQMIFTIRDEHGSSEVFSRWGKTKKITQFSLAKLAWYHFVENDLIPRNDDEEEENFYEVYDVIDSSTGSDTDDIDNI